MFRVWVSLWALIQMIFFFKGVSDIKFGELDRLLARNQEQQVTTKMFEESGEDEDNAIEYF